MQQAIWSACGELDLQSFGIGNEDSCFQSKDVLAQTAGTILFFKKIDIHAGRMASGLKPWVLYTDSQNLPQTMSLCLRNKL